MVFQQQLLFQMCGPLGEVSWARCLKSAAEDRGFNLNLFLILQQRLKSSEQILFP